MSISHQYAHNEFLRSFTTFSCIILSIISFVHCRYQLYPEKNYPNSSNNESIYSLQPTTMEQINDFGDLGITIHKCCEPDVILDYQLSCRNHKAIDFEPKPFLEKMEHYFVLEQLAFSKIYLSRITINFNYLQNIWNPTDGFVYHWDSSKPRSDAKYAFSADDGSLLQMDQKHSKIINKFPTNTYCVDYDGIFHDTIMVYVNPCRERVCIRKCCPEDHYYSITYNTCHLSYTLEPMRVNFYFLTTPSLRDVSYHTNFGYPNCWNEGDCTRINNSSTSSVYIQEDGNLLVDKSIKYLYYNTNYYCLDIFSDDKNISYLNGFYDEKSAAAILIGKIDLYANMIEPSTQSTQVSMEFGATEQLLELNNRQIRIISSVVNVFLSLTFALVLF
ncbi:unnamed protein product [Phyllotreta striolata]|uniref:Methuselah N-terminal domain-containing protein n=1 Tax=Phyllotreta striolata TaxID=444603 RepID=A0A9N9THM5_PHYSR|nr:unnamed protein product [Phyllotreta striolata]